MITVSVVLKELRLRRKTAAVYGERRWHAVHESTKTVVDHLFLQEVLELVII